MSDIPKVNPKKIIDALDLNHQDPKNPFQKGPDLLTAGAQLRLDQESMSATDFKDRVVDVVNLGLAESKRKVVIKDDQIILESPWSVSQFGNETTLTQKSDAADKNAVKRNSAYHRVSTEVASQQ